jgi:hypothetical protein
MMVLRFEAVEVAVHFVLPSFVGGGNARDLRRADRCRGVLTAAATGIVAAKAPSNPTLIVR